MSEDQQLTPDEFTLDLSEEFLRAYASYLKQLRENEPGKTFLLRFTVDVNPANRGKPPEIAVYARDSTN